MLSMDFLVNSTSSGLVLEFLVMQDFRPM